MNQDTIKVDLSGAIESLFANQPNIFEFTSETGQTEWNLAHHLAVELHKVFKDFDCDLELRKVNYQNRRPDIVLHKRGNHESNFLVIEVKRDGTKRELRDDMAKIKGHWFDPPLRYRFGAVVDLRGDLTYDLEVLENRLTVPED